MATDAPHIVAQEWPNAHLQVVAKAGHALSDAPISAELVKIMDKSDDVIKFVPDRPGQDKRYAIKSRKIKKELNFEPKIKFDNGISSTMDW